MSINLKRAAPLAFAAFAVFAGSAFAADVAASSVPSATGYYNAPPTIVQGNPMTADERITGDVVDALAQDPRLVGKIGVETDQGIVTLTGRLTDTMQLEWAEDDAQGVSNVNDVDDEITPSVGRF